MTPPVLPVKDSLLAHLDPTSLGYADGQKVTEAPAVGGYYNWYAQNGGPTFRRRPEGIAYLQQTSAGDGLRWAQAGIINHASNQSNIEDWDTTMVANVPFRGEVWRQATFANTANPRIVRIFPAAGAGALPVDVQRTASVTVANPSATTEISLWFDQSDTGGSWHTLAPGEVKRVTATGVRTTAYHFSDIEGNPGTTFLFRDWQIEDGPIANAYVAGTFSPTSDYTLFVVARMRGGANQRIVSGLSNNALFGWHGGTEDDFYSEGWVLNSATAATTNLKSYAFRRSGTTSGIWSSGTLLTANTAAGQGLNGLTTNGYLGASEFSNAEIYEVIVYSRALSDGEIQQVDRYLREKFFSIGVAATESDGPVVGSVLGPVFSGTPSQGRLHVRAASDSLPPTYPGEVLASDPVAYYRLGESSGNALDSSRRNQAPQVYRTGIVRQAGLVSGDGAVAVGTSTTGVATGPSPEVLGLTGSGETVEGWYRTPSTETRGGFFKAGTGPDGYGLGVGSSSFDGTGWNLVALYESRRWIATGVTLAPDTTYHWAMVISDEGWPRIYLDGVLVYSDDAGTPLAPTAEFNIGHTSGRALQAGVLDEVAVYDRAISSTEILAHYRKGAPRAPRGDQILPPPTTSGTALVIGEITAVLRPILTSLGYTATVNTAVTTLAELAGYDLIVDQGSYVAVQKSALLQQAYDAGFSILSNGNDSTNTHLPMVTGTSGQTGFGLTAVPDSDHYVGQGWSSPGYTEGDTGRMPTGLRDTAKAIATWPRSDGGGTGYVAFLEENPNGAGGRWFHIQPYGLPTTGPVRTLIQRAAEWLVSPRPASGEDTLVRTSILTRTAADSAPASDSAVRSLALPRSPMDTAPAVDDGTRLPIIFARSAADTLAEPTDGTATREGTFGRTPSDSAPADDAATRYASRSRTSDDTAPADDAVASSATLTRTSEDWTYGPTVTEATGQIFAFRTPDDDAPATDSASQNALRERTTADTAAASDALSSYLIRYRSGADSAPATDESDSWSLLLRVTDDSAPAEDSLDSPTLRQRTTTDEAGADDSALRHLTTPREATDSVEVFEVGDATASLVRSSDDEAPVDDVATHVPVYPRTASDEVSVPTDVADRGSIAFLRTSDDSAPAVDDGYRYPATRVRSTEDTITDVTDAATRVDSLFRSGADSAPSADAATRVDLLFRSSEDTAPADDSASPASTHYRDALSEVPEVTDEAIRVVGYLRDAADEAPIEDGPVQVASTLARLVDDTAELPAPDWVYFVIKGKEPHISPEVTITSVSRVKVSLNSGYAEAVVRFAFDKPVTEWVLRLGSSSRIDGIEVASESSSIPFQMAEAIVPASVLRRGSNTLTIYARSFDGYWSG